MRSYVTFTTSRFNQTEVRPHFINDCCFGEDCIAWVIAEWLVHITERAPLLDRLRGRGALTLHPELAPALHDGLRSAPDVRDVSWYHEDELRRGTSAGSAEPGVR